MSHKGSKYAKKQERLAESQTHLKADTIETSLSSLLSKMNVAASDVLSVVYDDVSFVSTFHNLDYESQIATYQVLTQLSKPSNPDEESQTDALYKLKRIAQSIGLEFVEQQDCYLSKDERHIIRVDFYGSVDCLKEGERKRKLSKPYMELMASPLKKRCKMEDYDFSTAPMWPLFARFSSFRKIEKKLKQYLVKNKIDPKILSLMDVRDFSDLIYNTFKKSAKDRKLETLRNLQKPKKNLKSYLISRKINPEILSTLDEKICKDLIILPGDEEIFEAKANFEKPISVRKRFVINIAERYGDQIAESLLSKGYDKRYVFAMLNAMKKYGATKTEKLVVTETHFTDRIIKDLKKLKINCFKKGEEIPQVLIDYLIESGYGNLIAARDENDQKLFSSDFPSFEVHHKHAVSKSGDLTNIASINYAENLCLVFDKIHTHVLHGMDIIVSDNRRDAYSRRTEFMDDDIIIMSGLNRTDQTFYTFSNGCAQEKRQKQDSATTASYDKCLEQLIKNHSAYNTKTIYTPTKKGIDINSVVNYIHKTYKQRPIILKMLKKRHEI